MPDSKNACSACGHRRKTVGAPCAITPNPMLSATTNRSRRLVLKSTWVRIRPPVAASRGNITSPALPSTTWGIACTGAVKFAISPNTPRIAPLAAFMNRDRTPVTSRTPTF